MKYDFDDIMTDMMTPDIKYVPTHPENYMLLKLIDFTTKGSIGNWMEDLNFLTNIWILENHNTTQ